MVNVAKGRCVARGAMGVISPPISKVPTKIFRLLKLLMYKPEKSFNENQRNC